MLCMPAHCVVDMPNKLAVDVGNSALLSIATTQTPSTLGGSCVLFCFIVIDQLVCYCLTLPQTINNAHNISQVRVGGNHLLFNRCVVPLLPNLKRTHPNSTL